MRRESCWVALSAEGRVGARDDVWNELGRKASSLRHFGGASKLVSSAERWFSSPADNGEVTEWQQVRQGRASHSAVNMKLRSKTASSCKGE